MMSTQTDAELASETIYVDGSRLEWGCLEAIGDVIRESALAAWFHVDDHDPVVRTEARRLFRAAAEAEAILRARP